MAFDKVTGRLAWQSPGQYRQKAPPTAVAAGVLYVQGHPGAKPPSSQDEIRLSGRKTRRADADAATRTPECHRSRDIGRAGSSRPTAEPNWRFVCHPRRRRTVVDPYQALVKLERNAQCLHRRSTITCLTSGASAHRYRRSLVTHGDDFQASDPRGARSVTCRRHLRSGAPSPAANATRRARRSNRARRRRRWWPRVRRPFRMERHRRAEVHALMGLARVVDHEAPSEGLGREPDAPVDFAQLPLPVDVVAVLPAIAVALSRRRQPLRTVPARPSTGLPAPSAVAGSRRA